MENKTSTAASTDSNDTLAMLSLIIGILALCGSFCGGICCVPIAIIGLVLGILGMKSEKNKTMAIIGTALSGLSIVIAILFSIFGAALNLSTL